MLEDFRNLVERITRADDEDIRSLDIEDAMRLAVVHYSKDKPDPVVVDVISAGGQALDVPARWSPGFSDVTAIEYPVGQVPPEYTIESWQTYTGPGNVEQILIDTALNADDVVRLTHTAFHQLDEDNDTIPEADREAVASYAAAILCDQLASLYYGDGDSTIQADTVDHGDKGRSFARRASHLRKRYRDEIGVAEQRNVAAGAVADWDNPNSQGRDRLQHSGRRR